MKKEDLDADPQSMDNRRLGAIARNPNHPMATHAKAELARRKVKKAEVGEGAMKRIATTQSNKADRMASGGKKGLETFKKKVNEVSSKTLSNYIRKSAADAGKPRQSARTQDKRIGGQKMADDKLRKMDGKGSAAKVAATPSTTTRMRSKGWIRGMSRVEADDATVRMYKDNPDMMKSKGPGGLKSLSKKAQKDVKKSMNEAATPAMKKAADELNSYAKKHGGIDKADFMKTAKMLSSGKAGMSLIKFVDGQDTEVYEKIIRVMAKHMGKRTVEKMFKVNIREESVNELSKDTMQSYWDKTKGDDAFSGSRKANNRLKGAINVTTKLDRIRKIIKKK